MSAPSENEVRELFIGGSDASTGAVTFAAEAANDLVEDRLGGEGVDAGTLDKVTRLVACHFLAATDPTEQSESIGGASASYERPHAIEDDLGETRYGRRAIALDPTGRLAEVGEDSSTFEAFGP